MTNKLPEVGKRYRSNERGFPSELICMDITYSHLNGVRVHGNSKTDIHRYDLDLFLKAFEELPEDNQPNQETLKSFSDYEKREGLATYDSVDELFDGLKKDDSCFSLEVKNEVDSSQIKYIPLGASWNFTINEEVNIYMTVGKQDDKVVSGSFSMTDEDALKLMKYNLFSFLYTKNKLQKENIEIEKAKEELRKVINFCGPTTMEIGYYKYVNASSNLLNALDNIKTQAEPVVDNKIEGNEHSVGKLNNCKICDKEFRQHHRGDKYCSNYCIRVSERAVKSVETELPWKDVSELPEGTTHVIVKFGLGGIEMAKFCERNGTFSNEDWCFNGKEFSKLKQGTSFCTLTDLINSIESMLSRQDELEERIKRLEGKNER